MQNSNVIRGLLAVLGMAVSMAQAAEVRTWMSRKGGTLEAELGSLTGDQVTLVTKDAKEQKYKVEDLSLADRQYLVEFGGGEASIITSGAPGLPEKDVHIDPATMKKLPTKLHLGETSDQLVFDLVQSTHFLVASAGKVRGQDTADTAERLWHGMAFQHMNFRKDWGDKRMLILLVDERKIYKSLGDWYVAFLIKEGDPDGAQRAKTVWQKAGSNQLRVPEDTAKEYNLHPGAILFNITEAASYAKPLGPFPTHCISSVLLSKQMSGVSSFGAEGYFAILTGHSYFKEISLAKKTETHLLDVSGTGNDEISSKAGFKDGTSWAKTLRPLVRKGKVTVKLEPMLKWTGAELNPERLVLIYSFAYYMESDSKRLCAFAKMIRRIESSNQIPPADEIAKIFGFETVAAFEADWKKFITDGEFK
ncbi:MAG: hypothetical protein WCJ66_02520 [Verrucomicrobiota bacterium]